MVQAVDQEILAELPDEVGVHGPGHLSGHVLEHIHEARSDVVSDLIFDDDARDDILLGVGALVDVPRGRGVTEVFPGESGTDDGGLEELVQVDVDGGCFSKVGELLIPERGVGLQSTGTKPNNGFILFLQECAALVDAVCLPPCEL